MFTNKQVVTYCLGSMTYGFVRRVHQVKDAHFYKLDKRKVEYKRVPMLLIDKTLSVTAATCIAPVMFPIIVYQDLAWLEITMTNRNPKDYE